MSTRKLSTCSLRSNCGHRWLENGLVQTVKEALGNPVFPVILECSRSLAVELQPFLSIFQADRPLSVLFTKNEKICCMGCIKELLNLKFWKPIQLLLR